MKNGLFEVGDVVKGLKGNGYFITNEGMLRAEVVEVFKQAPEHTMRINVLEHKVKILREGKTMHNVLNDTTLFELIKEEDRDFWGALEVLQ